MSVKLLPEKITNYLPTTVANADTTQFLNMKLGTMICFNLNGFVGWSASMFKRNIQHPSKFNISDVDVKTWATQMAASGKIKYAYLTVWNEFGFSLYPSKIVNDFGPITIPGYVAGGGIASMTVPAYQKYDVGSSANADQNIIGKFYTEFKKVGIEPGLYFNTERGYNHTARSANTNYIAEPAAGYFRKLQLMEANELYEIFTRYPFKYVWFDSDHTYPINNAILYNAIKNASPRTMITHASPFTVDATFATRFPYDIKAIEYFVAPANGNAAYSTTQAFNGVNYYIPKEITHPVLENEQYYAVNPDFLYDQPSFTPDELHTQAECQAVYDKAKANAANCCLAVFADKTGVIPQSQVDLISNITL